MKQIRIPDNLYIIIIRDKLGQLARKGDARDRLQKIKNLKEGKLEVKAIGRG